MEKIKEEIEIRKQSALGNMQARQDEVGKFEWQGVATGYQMSLNIIDQELQEFTFTRTPKKVKLSNIIEDLYHIGLTLIYDNNVITIKEADTNNEIVNINIFNNKIDVFDWVMFDSNNSFTNHYYYSYFDNIKWLYQYWIDGTYIEVDVLKFGKVHQKN